MTRKAINEVGNVYGRLTVIEFDGIHKGYARWKALCTCGNTTVVTGDHLRSGNTRSCGCLHQEVQKENGKHMAAGRWKDHVKVERPYIPTGRSRGRPSLPQEVRDQVAHLIRAGTSYRQICKMLLITTGTVSNIAKEYGLDKASQNGPTTSPAAITGALDLKP